MIQILTGSFILSVLHALIPSHWLSIVLVGKAMKWRKRDTLITTAIVGVSHTLSTILIGIIIGLIGYKLSSTFELVSKFVAPFILVLIGIIFFVSDLLTHHDHNHSFGIETLERKSKLPLIFSLSLAMFLSPCLEIEAYYFTAGIYGWLGISVVSLTYLLITVSGMLILVTLALKGAERLRSKVFFYQKRRVTGLVLVFLGIITFVFPFP